MSQSDWFHLGFTQHDEHNLVAAEDSYRKALIIDPVPHGGFRYLAKLSRKTGRPDLSNRISRWVAVSDVPAPIRNLGTTRLAFPTVLAFEPIQICNATCFCCPYTWLREQEGYIRKRMSRVKIEYLMNQFGRARGTHGYAGPLRVIPFRFSDPMLFRDLDVVLSGARRWDMIVDLTTNGVAFGARQANLIAEYVDVIGKISVSIIGCSPSQIRELMGVDVQRVLDQLAWISANRPSVMKTIRVNLKQTGPMQDEGAETHRLTEAFADLGFNVRLKRDWLKNRVHYGGFSTQRLGKPDTLSPIEQSADGFVSGCGWRALPTRMEVMVDGDVVLCCDEADRNKVLGNVFQDGMAEIWNGPLKHEHALIFDATFSEEKNGLICSTCSRASWG